MRSSPACRPVCCGCATRPGRCGGRERRGRPTRARRRPDGHDHRVRAPRRRRADAAHRPARRARRPCARGVPAEPPRRAADRPRAVATRRRGRRAHRPARALSVWFSWDTLVLTLAQCACVALPAAGLPPWTRRYRTGAWALVLPLNIAVGVVAIALIPTTADVLTWVALLLVPPGCALALGWAARGSRPWLAVLAAPLLALTWAAPDTRAGQVALTVLIAGSAITVGRLLAGAAPLLLLKLGVLGMAVTDAYLVFSGQLQAPNAVLIAAEPGLGLPQLQSAAFGHAGLGYGDFFAAAVVGGILAAEGRPQIRAAIAVFVVSIAWDQLFLIYDILPATIPPALVLLGDDAWRRRPRALRRTPPREALPST